MAMNISSAKKRGMVDGSKDVKPSMPNSGVGGSAAAGSSLGSPKGKITGPGSTPYQSGVGSSRDYGDKSMIR